MPTRSILDLNPTIVHYLVRTYLQPLITKVEMLGHARMLNALNVIGHILFEGGACFVSRIPPDPSRITESGPPDEAPKMRSSVLNGISEKADNAH